MKYISQKNPKQIWIGQDLEKRIELIERENRNIIIKTISDIHCERYNIY
jgi:hypothetical protein